MVSTLHSRRYRRFLVHLRAAREDSGLTQVEVAKRLRKPQSWASKSESGERRVDAVELCDFAKVYGKKLKARSWLDRIMHTPRHRYLDRSRDLGDL